MAILNRQTLLEAGVHHGHLAKKWSPDFSPYLFMKQKKQHVINVDKTIECLTAAGEAMEKIVEEGQKILFVGRKKQARGIVEEVAQKLNQPYISGKRWLGGMATNFATIKKLLKKLTYMEKQQESPSYLNLTKKEKLISSRRKKKLETLLKGILVLKKLPAAFFVIDVVKEFTAIKEAHKLGIPVFAIVDSNAPSKYVTYPIPGNDDKISSISVMVNYLASRIAQGLETWEKVKQEKRVVSTSQASSMVSIRENRKNITTKANPSSSVGAVEPAKKVGASTIPSAASITSNAASGKATEKGEQQQPSATTKKEAQAKAETATAASTTNSAASSKAAEKAQQPASAQAKTKAQTALTDQTSDTPVEKKAPVKKATTTTEAKKAAAKATTK